MDFWGILRDQQQKSGLNQEQFAEEIGIDRSTFSRLMSGGKPSYDTLDIIAKSLGLEILGEPREAPKKSKKICTEADLKDCIERMRESDPTDIMRMVLNIVDERRKRGSVKRKVV